MKFSVGYQLCADKEYLNFIIQNKEKINEVYFSFSDYPNGRNLTTINKDFLPFEAISEQIKDLKLLAQEGIKTNVLFNGNCYGKDSQSKKFFDKLGCDLNYLINNCAVISCTTTSLLIAKFIKANFVDIDVRASVNMGVSTKEAFSYVANYFDSYYIAREHNRNLTQLRNISDWCKENGKKLYGLANSGCFSFCPARTFHDNLVAHEGEISAMDNGYDFKGICHEFLQKTEDKSMLLSGLSFIRPNDVHLYENYFDGLKLATRVSLNPIGICKAYFEQKYVGNLLDLTEPNHSQSLIPNIIDDSLIPEGFGQKVLTCDKNCANCGYCKQVFYNAKVNLDLLTVNSFDY